MANVEKILLRDTIKSLPVSITKFRMIGYDGNYATAAGWAKGVSQQDCDAGDDLSVATHGIMQATAAGAINANVDVEVVGTVGKVTTKSTGVSVGHTLKAALADGDLILIQR